MISLFLFSEVCAENEFRCNDFRDECIPLSKVCDLNIDCLGGEDEKNCGTFTWYFKNDNFKLWNKLNILIFFFRYDNATSTSPPPPSHPFSKTMLRHKIFFFTTFFVIILSVMNKKTYCNHFFNINYAFLHNFYIGM